MDPYVSLIVQLSAIWLGAFLLLGALIVLWAKSHSPWILLALVGESASVLFRFVFSRASSGFGSFSVAELIPPITTLMLATGLLGYALNARKQHGQMGIEGRARTAREGADHGDNP